MTGICRIHASCIKRCKYPAGHPARPGVCSPVILSRRNDLDAATYEKESTHG